MAERTCPGCGTPLQLHPRERNKRIWCSDACRWWAKRHPGEARPTNRLCVHCKALIIGRNTKAIYCSDACGIAARPPQDRRMARLTDACLICGADITHRVGHATTCGKRCRTALANQRAGGRTPAALDADQRRRARKAGAVVEVFSRSEIFERDDWTCQLCELPVDADLAHPHPFSKSIDHIIPIALGGDHTRANVQLAHLRCNIRKGARTQPLQPTG